MRWFEEYLNQSSFFEFALVRRSRVEIGVGGLPMNGDRFIGVDEDVKEG